MSRWFRHYAGMMRDDKLVRVAIRSKQSVERVIWVYGAILESAAEVNCNGRYDFDAAEAAYFLRAGEDELLAIIAALEVAGHLVDGCVVKWGDRQFKSDTSAERQSRYRERKRAAEADPAEGAERDADTRVTSPSRHRDAPETETELETEETPIIPLAGGRRGKTLIPSDWQPPTVAELPPRARACAERWTPASYETEAEAFVCYWRSERKMKADWEGTWANRVIARNSAILRDQKFGNAAPAAKVERGPSWFREQAEFYDKIGRRDDAAECRQKAAAMETRAAA